MQKKILQNWKIQYLKFRALSSRLHKQEDDVIIKFQGKSITNIKFEVQTKEKKTNAKNKTM